MTLLVITFQQLSRCLSLPRCAVNSWIYQIWPWKISTLYLETGLRAWLEFYRSKRYGVPHLFLFITLTNVSCIDYSHINDYKSFPFNTTLVIFIEQLDISHIRDKTSATLTSSKNIEVFNYSNNKMSLNKIFTSVTIDYQNKYINSKCIQGKL